MPVRSLSALIRFSLPSAPVGRPRTLPLASFAAMAVWAALAGTGWSDQIFTSTSKKIYNGRITAMTATAIQFSPAVASSGAPTEIPVNEVVRITFEDAPADLTRAQTLIREGEYEEALTHLEKDSAEAVNRREIQEEVAYSRALCMAQLALTGGYDTTEAGRALLKFVQNSPNSYHYLKACELIGDLAANSGNFAGAQEYYNKVAQAPWPDYKMRAHIALGRAYLSQGKAAQADKEFDEALANEASGALADLQRTAAQVGKARCQVLTGKTDVALRTLQAILNQADEKNPEICALAYNALGTALRKSGKPKEAVLAFLRVHLQYEAALPDAHAEAVANLESLFTETHKPVHAKEMRAILDSRYKNSRWAKGAK